MEEASKTSWSVELSELWEHYGIEELSKNLDTLFPRYEISLEAMLEQVLEGDLLGALGSLLEQLQKQITGESIIFVICAMFSSPSSISS